MLHISVDEIKHGTVGATFKVAFSVPIDELPQLRELHDKYAELNMKSFPLTATKADTSQMCQDCKYQWWNSEMKRYECTLERCPY